MEPGGHYSDYTESSNNGDIILSYGDSLIRRDDLQVLQPKNWLNDTIISFYMEYIYNTCKIPTNIRNTICLISCSVTQCIKLCGGAEHILNDIITSDTRYIILPLSDSDSFTWDGGHSGQHWSLAVFDINKQHLYHFDSMGNSNQTSANELMDNLKPVLHQRGSNGLIELTNMKTLQQNNGYDCGIHVLCNVDLVLKQIEKTGNIEDCEISQQSVVDEKRSQLLDLINQLAQQTE